LAVEARRDFFCGWAAVLLPPDAAALEAGAVVDVAWAKSSARAGALGWVRVEDEEGVEKPWNWEVRSSSCFWRVGRETAMLAALLYCYQPLFQ